MRHSRFLGSKDPNAVILQDVFPLTDISISTQLEYTQNDFQIVSIEGNETVLRFIESHARPLETASWRFGDPILAGDTELRMFFNGTFSIRAKIELLALRLRNQFVDLCDFVLSDRSRIIVMRDSKQTETLTFDYVATQRKGTIRVPAIFKPDPLSIYKKN